MAHQVATRTSGFEATLAGRLRGMLAPRDRNVDLVELHPPFPIGSRRRRRTAVPPTADVLRCGPLSAARPFRKWALTTHPRGLAHLRCARRLLLIS